MAAVGRKQQRRKKQTARDQGVPDVYLGQAGSFRPGMDARYKSDLVNSALGLESKDAKMTFEPADAVKRLRARAWTPWLARKKAALKAKAKA